MFKKFLFTALSIVVSVNVIACGSSTQEMTEPTPQVSAETTESILETEDPVPTWEESEESAEAPVEEETVEELVILDEPNTEPLAEPQHYPDENFWSDFDPDSLSGIMIYEKVETKIADGGDLDAVSYVLSAFDPNTYSHEYEFAYYNTRGKAPIVMSVDYPMTANNSEIFMPDFSGKIHELYEDDKIVAGVWVFEVEDFSDVTGKLGIDYARALWLDGTNFVFLECDSRENAEAGIGVIKSVPLGDITPEAVTEDVTIPANIDCYIDDTGVLVWSQGELISYVGNGSYLADIENKSMVVENESEPKEYIPTSRDSRSAVISPDGTQVAYLSASSLDEGKDELCIYNLVTEELIHTGVTFANGEYYDDGNTYTAYIAGWLE